MGPLFRILVFILALGTLGTGTAWLLARERQREATRERLIVTSAGTDSNAAATFNKLRAQQAAAERDLIVFGFLSLGCLFAVALDNDADVFVDVAHCSAFPARAALTPQVHSAVGW
jgi:hypothetical protein